MNNFFRKMKIISITISLLFVFVITKGQTDSTNEYFNPSNLKQNNVSGKWGVNAGAFGGSFNGNGYFGSFIAPNYNVDLTKKLSIQAGIIFSSFNFSNKFSENNSNRFNSLNGTFFYTQGSYKISNKVFLTGGAYTSLNNAPKNNINPAFYNEVKGGKLGIGYIFNEHSSMYFEIQLNKGNSPFNTYSSPYSHNLQNSVFSW